MSEVPKDRWDVDEFFDPDPAAPGKVVTRRQPSSMSHRV